MQVLQRPHNERHLHWVPHAGAFHVFGACASTKKHLQTNHLPHLQGGYMGTVAVTV